MKRVAEMSSIWEHILNIQPQYFLEVGNYRKITRTIASACFPAAYTK